MNTKDIIDYMLHIQQQSIGLLIRVSALEKVLKDSNLLDLDKYSKEIESLTNTVTDKISEKIKETIKPNEETSNKE